MKRPLLAIALGCLIAAPVMSHAQAPAGDSPLPAFEVASIKPNRSGGTGVRMAAQPGGQLNMVNITLRNIIMRAYGIQANQLIGGPGWMDSDRFDIIAKAEGNAPPEQLNLMLQSLLAERFQLVAHRETRELPVYELVLARADGRLGPGLQPAAGNCAPPLGGGRTGGPAPNAPVIVQRGAGPGEGGARGEGGQRGAGPALGGGCTMMMGNGAIFAAGQPLSTLITPLSAQVGRPVIDRTGLTGSFDFALQWLPDGPRGGGAFPDAGGASPLPPINSDAPSLFTALQEQLGLKLESARGPVEVLVIDRVEQPTED